MHIIRDGSVVVSSSMTQSARVILSDFLIL